MATHTTSVNTRLAARTNPPIIPQPTTHRNQSPPPNVQRFPVCTQSGKGASAPTPAHSLSAPRSPLTLTPPDDGSGDSQEPSNPDHSEPEGHPGDDFEPEDNPDDPSGSDHDSE